MLLLCQEITFTSYLMVFITALQTPVSMPFEFFENCHKFGGTRASPLNNGFIFNFWRTQIQVHLWGHLYSFWWCLFWISKPEWAALFVFGRGLCVQHSTRFTFFFFFKFLLDTCPFVGPLIPLFWTSGDISSGFQSQSGFCLIRTWRRRM